jgi:hypothetical protein
MRVGSNQIKSEYRVVSDAIEALYQLSTAFLTTYFCILGPRN